MYPIQTDHLGHPMVQRTVYIKFKFQGTEENIDIVGAIENDFPFVIMTDTEGITHYIPSESIARLKVWDNETEMSITDTNVSDETKKKMQEQMKVMMGKGKKG